MKAPDRIWRLLILSAILLPFLAVALSVASLPDAAVQGDDAVMELGVRQTMRGENLLGPYSRFHFNHPGPAYFHVMVPLYAFSGAAHGSFLLTAVLVNLLAVLLILFAIGDRPQGMLATRHSAPF